MTAGFLLAAWHGRAASSMRDPLMHCVRALASRLDDLERGGFVGSCRGFMGATYVTLRRLVPLNPLPIDLAHGNTYRLAR
jgi:hypothetical protein